LTGSLDANLYQDASVLHQRAAGLVESVRNLSHDLHPDVLRHAGLEAALADYCNEIQRSHPVMLEFDVRGDFNSIHPGVAVCLYRVAQEVLRNVIKHAGARRGEVRLIRSGEQAELMIADDGKGFDAVKVRASGKGLGLISVNERVRLVGGTVSIVTELNRGTRVRIRIPSHRLAPQNESELYEPMA
jgi:two-component system sensor histidine kinase UhpB